MNTVLNEILKKSADLFQRYGIRSVAMDDIAKELSISKKTLYNHIKDKKDLIEKVIQMQAQSYDLKIRLESLKLNAIEEYLEVYKSISKIAELSHPCMEFDLRKYYPEIHSRIDEERRVFMLEGIKGNIMRGIKEGYYRKDFNVDFVTHWHMLRINELIASNFLNENKLDAVDVLHEVFSYHLHAITSPKGIAEFKRLLKEKDNE